MKLTKRILIFTIIAILCFSVASCTSGSSGTSGGAGTSGTAETSAGSGAGATATAPPEATNPAQGAAAVVDRDREGNPIALPASIDKLIVLGPSNNEVLIALGFGDRIIGADEYSVNIPNLPEGIPLFSMLTPDGERIIELEADVIIVTGMSKVGGNDPFQVIKDAGVCVVYIPSSSSIEGIKEDIRFLAAMMGASGKASAIIAEMEREIEAISAIAQTITEKKKVYYEVGAAPHMVSLGQDTFIHEMIELIGAVNILGDMSGWVSVADEAILDANPDVILTSVNYIDDPIGEIKARPGWGEIKAIQDDAVHYVDTDASNRPSHNIIKAMKIMAKAVYPEKF